MTPETKRIVGELRNEFYHLFATAMNTPVKIIGASYSNNSPIAAWVDHTQRMNYINIYAYTAPDDFIPKRPFLLRVAINKSAGRITFGKQAQDCQGLNCEWDFALTLLPAEIIDFLPGIVSLIKAHDRNLKCLPGMLYPFGSKQSKILLLDNNFWTESAWLVAESINYQ